MILFIRNIFLNRSGKLKIFNWYYKIWIWSKCFNPGCCNKKHWNNWRSYKEDLKAIYAITSWNSLARYGGNERQAHSWLSGCWFGSCLENRWIRSSSSQRIDTENLISTDTNIPVKPMQIRAFALLLLLRHTVLQAIRCTQAWKSGNETRHEQLNEPTSIERSEITKK